MVLDVAGKWGGIRKMFVKDQKKRNCASFGHLCVSQLGYCGGDECSLGRNNPRAWGIGKENLTRGVFIRCPPTLAHDTGLDGLAGAPVCLLPPPEGVLTSLLPTCSFPSGADVPQGCPEGTCCQLQAAHLNGKAPNDPTCKPCPLQRVKIGTIQWYYSCLRAPSGVFEPPCGKQPTPWA